MKSKALFLLYSFLIVFSFVFFRLSFPPHYPPADGMQINYLESDFFQSYYKIQNHIRSGKNINDANLNNDMFISEYSLKDGLVEFKIEKTVQFCLLGKRKIEKTYVVYLKDYLFQPS